MGGLQSFITQPDTKYSRDRHQQIVEPEFEAPAPAILQRGGGRNIRLLCKALWSDGRGQLPGSRAIQRWLANGRMLLSCPTRHIPSNLIRLRIDNGKNDWCRRRLGQPPSAVATHDIVRPRLSRTMSFSNVRPLNLPAFSHRRSRSFCRFKNDAIRSRSSENFEPISRFPLMVDSRSAICLSSVL
jgi:hypothetical protein